MKILRQEMIGYLGGVCILVALFLLNIHAITPQHMMYSGLNFLGGLGIAYTAFKKKDHPSLWLNLIFAGVAIWFGIQNFF